MQREDYLVGLTLWQMIVLVEVVAMVLLSIDVYLSVRAVVFCDLADVAILRMLRLDARVHISTWSCYLIAAVGKNHDVSNATSAAAE